MTLNFPGPYTIEVVYDVDGLTHTSELTCYPSPAPAPGDLFSSISVNTWGGGLVPLNTAVESYLTEYNELFGVAMSVIEVILWHYPTPGGPRNFISAYQPTANVGTNGAGNEPAHQITLSFRTAGGGIMKIVALEGALAGQNQEPLTTNPATASGGVAAYVLGPDGWFGGRDDTQPIAPLRLSRGQNERVFRKRFR